MEDFKSMLVLLLFLPLAAMQGQNQCTPDNDQLLPVDGDCTRFRRCHTGHLTPPESCAQGTAFSFDRQLCVFPNEVQTPGCAQQTEQSEGQFSQYAPLCAQAPPGVGFNESWNVPHPDYCNAFIACGNGRAIPACQICAEGTIFLDNSFSVCKAGTQRDCTRGNFVNHFDVITVRAFQDDCRAPPPQAPTQFPGQIPGGGGGQQFPGGSGGQFPGGSGSGSPFSGGSGSFAGSVPFGGGQGQPGGQSGGFGRQPGGFGRQPGGSGRQSGGFGGQPGGFGGQSGGFGGQPGGFGGQPGGSGRQPGGSGRQPGGAGWQSEPSGTPSGAEQWGQGGGGW